MFIVYDPALSVFTKIVFTYLFVSVYVPPEKLDCVKYKYCEVAGSLSPPDMVYITSLIFLYHNKKSKL